MSNFSLEWRNLQRAVDMHMQMENDGFFQLLDNIGDSAVNKAGLRDEHDHDLQLRKNVDKAISENDSSALTNSFETWREKHLKHLVHEEEVMMPLIPKAGKSCVEHGQVIHDQILSSIASNEEFDWTLGWILEKLASSDSGGQPSDVMVRVFVWGLHYCADDSQWQRWLPIVNATVSDQLYQHMVKTFRIDRPGRIGEISDLNNEFSYLAPDAPKPMPFAIMRNTHEALRISINEMSELL